MPIERETIIERPAATETTIVDSGRSGFGLGSVLIAILAIVLALWAFSTFLSGAGGDAVQVDLPTVSVDP